MWSCMSWPTSDSVARCHCEKYGSMRTSPATPHGTGPSSDLAQNSALWAPSVVICDLWETLSDSD